MNGSLPVRSDASPAQFLDVWTLDRFGAPQEADDDRLDRVAVRNDPKCDAEHDAGDDGRTGDGYRESERYGAAERVVETAQPGAVEPRIEQFHRRYQDRDRGQHTGDEPERLPLVQVPAGQPASVGNRDIAANPQSAKS